MTTSRTKSVSAETTDPTNDPAPRAASVTASSTEEYGIKVDTGPNASTSCG